MMLSSMQRASASCSSSGAARASPPMVAVLHAGTHVCAHSAATSSSGRCCAAPQPAPAAFLGSSSSSRRSGRSSRGSSSRPGVMAAASAAQQELAPIPSTDEGSLISKTEVAAFIQRDDFMDQMYRWAHIEAGEGGIRNFGLPMNVEPFYNTSMPDPMIWGFKVAIFKEGTHMCDLGVMFDKGSALQHEWVGRGEDGFPVMEGKSTSVLGEFFEIWKLDKKPVDETLRAAIKSYCTGMVTAINRYYAFGSVFVDDGQ